MIRLTRTRKAQWPKMRPGRALMLEIGKVLEGSILDNIKRQIQVDGTTPIQRNAPLTRKRKQERGRPLLSLVDEKHRFVRGAGASWRSTATSSSVTVKPATRELRDLSLRVQGGGYEGWFGLSRDGAAVVRKLLQHWIRQQFRSAEHNRIRERFVG